MKEVRQTHTKEDLRTAQPRGRWTNREKKTLKPANITNWESLTTSSKHSELLKGFLYVSANAEFSKKQKISYFILASSPVTVNFKC